jgi:hypothetical protein
LREILNMSEQKAEQTGGEPGSLHAGPTVHHSSKAPSEPVASAQESVKESSDVDSPTLVPEQGGAGETAETEAPKADAPKPDAPEPDAPKADTPRSNPGKVMIMSSGDRAWDSNNATGPEPEAASSSGMFGKRRLSALAAVAVLATVAGALGGALATAGLTRVLGDDAAIAGKRTLEASVARIDADIANLKVSVEHTAKMGMSQFNKTSDRLDRVEKAQLEPAAKLAKLGEAVEKLRATPAVASAAVVTPQAAAAPVAAAARAANEATASITPSAAAAPADQPKLEVARLPTVEGWMLRGVANGVALIEGRRGIFEVYAGDLVPGAGRVDAIRRQDGRWVVVTSKGLIVGR